ncbi:MAG: hypothetical protein ACC650_06140 [Gammaproteobacteria bacterium]
MSTIMHINWLEVLEISLFVLLIFIVLLLLVRCFVIKQRPVTADINTAPVGRVSAWQNTPELQLLMLALPLHLLWEIAQFPLFTVWHEGDWGYILYGLVHCTLGDLIIMLAAFWLLALLNSSRYWIYSSPVFLNLVLFTATGLGYTIYSEIVNTRIKGTWGYTELMPIVPLVEIGGMPFMQWLLIPSVIIWLMRLLKSQHIT